MEENGNEKVNVGLIHGLLSVAIALLGGSVFALSVVTDGAISTDWYVNEYQKNLALSFIFGGISFSSFVGMIFSIGGILSMIKRQITNKALWALNLFVPVLLTVSFVLYRYYDAKLPIV